MNLRTLRKAAAELGVDVDAFRAPSLHQQVEQQGAFGAWTILTGSYDKEQRTVLCRCRCGTERRVDIDTLTVGSSLSCGCRQSGGRKSTPWECVATGERVSNTAAAARKAGMSYMGASARLRAGKSIFDSEGREWRPLPAESRPYGGGGRVQPRWICLNDGVIWPTTDALAAELGIITTTLLHNIAGGRAYVAADGRQFAPEGSNLKRGERRVRGRSRPVVCVETGARWSSSRQLALHLGVPKTNVASHLMKYGRLEHDGKTYIEEAVA